MERRKKKKGVRVVVCEYSGIVIDVYGDKLKKDECGCRKEWWVKSRRKEGIRWNDVCKCSGW